MEKFESSSDVMAQVAMELYFETDFDWEPHPSEVRANLDNWSANDVDIWLRTGDTSHFGWNL